MRNKKTLVAGAILTATLLMGMSATTKASMTMSDFAGTVEPTKCSTESKKGILVGDFGGILVGDLFGSNCDGGIFGTLASMTMSD